MVVFRFRSEIVVMMLFLQIARPQEEGFDLLWLSNNQEVKNKTLRTDGRVPYWIKGSLVRNGPGRFEMGPHSMNHYFDGFAKLAKFEFDRGSVRFSTKFIMSDFYKDSLKENDIAAYLTLGHIRPDINFLRKLAGFLRGVHNMGVNVKRLTVGESTKYYALNDIWRMYEFNPKNLNTVGCIEPPTHVKQQSHGHLTKRIQGLHSIPLNITSRKTMDLNKKNYSFRKNTRSMPIERAGDVGEFSMDPRLSSAHPQKEHGRNNWITFYTHWSPIGETHVYVYRIPSLEKPELITVLELDKIRYMHSFGMTKNHVVFTINSCYVDMAEAVTSVPFDGITCDHENHSSVFVVDLRNNQVTKLQTKPLFVMHHINAYEADDNTIICDMTDHHNFSLVKNLTRDILLDKQRRNSELHPISRYVRLIIHLDTNDIEFKHFDAKPEYQFVATSEFPVINSAKRYTKHCFIYGVTFTSDARTFANISLTKKDVCAGGDSDGFWQVENHYPSEPRFLASPGATEEDDGVLLSVVLDGRKRKSYLAIINAKTMKLLSVTYSPVTIPFGIHGKFFEEL